MSQNLQQAGECSRDSRGLKNETFGFYDFYLELEFSE